MHFLRACLNGEKLSPSQNLLAIVFAIDAIASDMAPMPNEVMNALTDAREVAIRAAIGLPATCESEVANKLRLIAHIMEFDGGEHVNEREMTARAVSDLVELRAAQWDDVLRGAA